MSAGITWTLAYPTLIQLRAAAAHISAILFDFADAFERSWHWRRASKVATAGIWVAQVNFVAEIFVLCVSAATRVPCLYSAGCAASISLITVRIITVFISDTHTIATDRLARPRVVFWGDECRFKCADKTSVALARDI